MLCRWLTLLGERLQPKLLLTVSKEKQSEALLDAGDLLKISRNNWISLPHITYYNPKFFPEGATANDIVSVDDSVTSTEPLMTSASSSACTSTIHVI